MIKQYTVDWDYFAGSKVTWAKYSMRFIFVEAAAYEFILTPEILKHGVFTFGAHHKKDEEKEDGSVRNGTTVPFP